MNMDANLIVSGHPATVAALRALYPELRDVLALTGAPRPGQEGLAVSGPHEARNATIEDVRGKVAWGNLPADLAAAAAEYRAVSFSGPPPRGTELDAAALAEIGMRVRMFAVREVQGGAAAYLMAAAEAVDAQFNGPTEYGAVLRYIATGDAAHLSGFGGLPFGPAFPPKA